MVPTTNFLLHSWLRHHHSSIISLVLAASWGSPCWPTQEQPFVALLADGGGWWLVAGKEEPPVAGFCLSWLLGSAAGAFFPTLPSCSPQPGGGGGNLQN